MSVPSCALRYRTGEPILVGDRVTYDGRPGRVTAVQQPDPLSPLRGYSVAVQLEGGGGVQMAGVLLPPALVLVKSVSPPDGDRGSTQ